MMKYLCIIILAILGLVELVFRVTAILLTMTILLLIDEDFARPWCWSMAEKVLG